MSHTQNTYSVADLDKLSERIETVTLQLHGELAKAETAHDRKTILRTLNVIHTRRELLMTFINRLNSEVALTQRMVKVVAETKGKWLPLLEYHMRNVSVPNLVD